MELSKKIGMRLLCLFVSLICLLLLILPVSAEQKPRIASTYAPAAAVYRSASTDAIIVGNVLHGTPLSVLGEVGDFYAIDCYGMTGFILQSQVHHSIQDGYTVNCDSRRPDKVFSQFPSSQVSQMQNSLLSMGRDFLGVPYVYGGTSPRGFDCSGFVSYVYQKHLFSLHRCADEQMQDGVIIEQEDLQKGDLLFFSVYGPWIASHVGIYVGNGKMIHAGSQGIGYGTLDNPYWATTYVGARRILCTDPNIPEIRDPDTETQMTFLP